MPLQLQLMKKPTSTSEASQFYSNPRGAACLVKEILNMDKVEMYYGSNLESDPWFFDTVVLC